MNYINYKCPVCKNSFTEEDDVVVCPDCGTPHHRECYIQNGKCFNEDKHGAKEPIEVKFADVEEKEEFEDNATLSEKITEENKNENAQEIIQEIIDDINNSSKDLSLNGKHISFYEAAIGKNQKYYIPRFMLMDKTKKGVSWNVVAFFVPLAWTLYRKMYKFAAIILALYVLLIGSISFTILSNEEIMTSAAECVEEDPNFYEDVILYRTSNSNVSLTEKQMKFNKLMETFKLPIPVQIVMYIITYGVRIIMGIYATNLYYKKLIKNIENVDNLDLSQDMKRSVLFRKCGTLPFIIAAIIGFFEWQMF